MTRQEAGRLGGRATYRKHGPSHMVAIGRRGYAVTLARHWQGDAVAYHRWLVARGWTILIDGLIDARMRAAIAAGTPIVCEELPLLEGDDLDDDTIPW